MADDDTNGSDKTIKETLEELLQGVLDALESLVSPQPELVPIPIRSRRRARR